MSIGHFFSHLALLLWLLYRVMSEILSVVIKTEDVDIRCSKQSIEKNALSYCCRRII